MPLSELLPDALCVILCVIAAAFDLRTYQIPNWIPATAAATGLIINPVLGHGALSALAGGGVLLVIAGSLGAARLLGMGDVKLLAAAGTLLRWPLAPRLIVYVALAGGVLSLVLAARRGAA